MSHPRRPDAPSGLPLRVRQRVRPWRNRLRRSLRADVARSRGVLVDQDSGLLELTAAAERMVQLRRFRLALALAARADLEFGHTPAITRLRRSVPGFVGEVDRGSVREAAAQVRGRAAPGWVRSTALAAGRGASTESVVEHRMWPGKVTVVRKTVRGAAPAEALLYRSRLLGESGGGWRTPRVWAVEQSGADRWHIFLEDLRPSHRPAAGSDLQVVARALGELATTVAPEVVAAQDWLPRPALALLGGLGTGVHRWAAALPDREARRLLEAYAWLLTSEARLAAVQAALPRTLCHGDAHLGNVVLGRAGPGPVVIFDWSAVHVGPVGSDLGELLALPNSELRSDPHQVVACLEAYTGGLGRTSLDEAGLGYRLRLVWKSLRWQATRPNLSAEVLHPPETDRICDAVDWIRREVDP